MSSTTGVLLVSNASAGGGTQAAQAEAIAARLESRFGTVLHVAANTPDEAAAAVIDALKHNIGAVASLGGDGTLNTVASAMVTAPAHGSSLLVLPGGTGNDFARALGIPLDMEAALDHVLAASPRRVDVGEVNGRIFINASAGGFFGEVSEATTESLKSSVGRLAYLIGGGRVFLEHEPCEASLVADTQYGPLKWSGPLSMFAVCNGQTTGGGKPLAPNASVDDGWFDAFVVEGGTRTDLAAVLVQMSGGQHLDDDRVLGFRMKAMAIRFECETPYNVDGEVMKAGELTYLLRPGALSVFA